MTTFDSENPEDLWKWMAAWEAKTGGSLLAIPHNGNLSNGKMFALSTFLGNPLTREWAETRAQLGADVRDHPDQGRWRNAARRSRPPTNSPTSRSGTQANLAGVPKKPGMIEREYARRRSRRA